MYTIKLVPFIIPENFTIKGQLELIMTCHSVGENVTLHVKDMELDENSISLIDMETNSLIEISKHAYDKDREFYIAHLSKPLTPGQKYIIKIDYVAELNDKLAGFYRSQYKDLTTGKDE